MSNLTVKGNASGTGTVILEAPNTNTNRTITLPDSTGTLATTADIPAAGGMTLLGTIATTSGSSASLSGLTLTDYKFLQFVIVDVSGTATSSQIMLNGRLIINLNVAAAGDFALGGGSIDLASGVFWFVGSNIYNAGASFLDVGRGGASGLTTSSTSITFTISAGSFDAGSIRIYGVK